MMSLGKPGHQITSLSRLELWSELLSPLICVRKGLSHLIRNLLVLPAYGSMK